MTESKNGGIWDELKVHLKDLSIEIEDMCGSEFDKSKIKIVCMAPGLADSVKEMGKSIRDQVVMVRIDDDSNQALDDWVEAGAVKSRSEAAALFIREGLKVRASELDRLKEALEEVQSARQRLRDEAKNIFGPDDKDEESESHGKED